MRKPVKRPRYSIRYFSRSLGHLVHIMDVSTWPKAVRLANNLPEMQLQIEDNETGRIIDDEELREMLKMKAQ